MADDVETLSLDIAQRRIRVTVKKEWVYYYREAEKIINDTILKFAKQWNYADHQDLISKVLLEFVVRWIENEERLNEYKENLIPMMTKLNTLADTLERKS